MEVCQNKQIFAMIWSFSLFLLVQKVAGKSAAMLFVANQENLIKCI